MKNIFTLVIILFFTLTSTAQLKIYRTLPYDNSTYMQLGASQKYNVEIRKEDILHDIGSMCPFWFKLFPKPSLTTFHHYEPPRTFKDILASFPSLPYLIPKEKMTDVIVTVSETSKKDLLENFYITNKKVMVIPNGFDSNVFYRNIISESITENTLFYAATLTPRKGHEYLIKALPIILREIRDVQVLIAGDGFLKNKLMAMSRKLGVEKNIRFLGFLPLSELLKYYQTSKAFVFPTTQEGFGMVAIESMACGTPVVTSKIEPLTSIIGDAGLFFEPGNHFELAQQVITILRDESLRKELSKKSIEQVKNYSWEKVADMYLDIYQELLDRHIYPGP